MKTLVLRLRSEAGELIIETLVSLLIAALALTFLAGSIVSSANANAKTADDSGNQTVFPQVTETASTSVALSVTVNSGSADTSSKVTILKDSGGGFYAYVAE